MDKLTYFVLGDPGALCNNVHYHNGRIWESHKVLRARWREQLEEQHSPHNVLSRPVDLNIFFYFQKTQSSNKNQAHPLRGDTGSMTKFVAECSDGIIFKNQGLIININCHKVFVDSNPRTEFYILETDE